MNMKLGQTESKPSCLNRPRIVDYRRKNLFSGKKGEINSILSSDKEELHLIKPNVFETINKSEKFHVDFESTATWASYGSVMEHYEDTNPEIEGYEKLTKYDDEKNIIQVYEDTNPDIRGYEKLTEFLPEGEVNQFTGKHIDSLNSSFYSQTVWNTDGDITYQWNETYGELINNLD